MHGGKTYQRPWAFLELCRATGCWWLAEIGFGWWALSHLQAALKYWTSPLKTLLFLKNHWDTCLQISMLLVCTVKGLCSWVSGAGNGSAQSSCRAVNLFPMAVFVYNSVPCVGLEEENRGQNLYRWEICWWSNDPISERTENLKGLFLYGNPRITCGTIWWYWKGSSQSRTLLKSCCLAFSLLWNAFCDQSSC